MSLLQQEKVPLAELSDGQLAYLTLEGNECAFEALVKRYSSPLFHFIYHFLGDYDGACDVLQQVMVRLYTSLPTLHQERSFRAWLFRVAHNRAIDELRSRRCLHFSELEPTSTDETELSTITDNALLPQELLEYRELQSNLRRSIAQLPLHYREIVLLRYLLQLTFAEISQIVNKPETTVKTYFHRAKHLLRAALQVEHAYELLPER
ncbi:MAG TPA: sigma-70 family RNA polymerase sigma factor [Ktedonobacteraceae bacterium]